MKINDQNHQQLRSNFRHLGNGRPAPSQTKELANSAASPKLDISQFLQAENEENAAVDIPRSEIEVVKRHIKGMYDTIRRNKLTQKIELEIMGETEELTDWTVNGWLDDLWSNHTYTSVDGRNGRPLVKKVTIDKNKLYTLVENYSFAPTFDPIDEYFKGVAPLAEGTTETPEIDKFISCFTCENDDETVKTYFKAWLAGVFVNYFSDTEVFDRILILQSDQGTGKTTAIEHYLLKPFKDYVIKNFQWNSGNKDELVKLATSIVIFDDELSAMKKSEVEDLKKITSMTKINGIRPAYGRTTINYIRRASFIGATNNTNITSDATGSRRLLIVELLRIDWKGIAAVDYDLLWSEAYNYFHVQNNEVTLDNDKIEANNNRFKFVTGEEEYLERFFDFTREPNKTMTATDVLDYIKQHVPHFQSDAVKVGRALRSKGAKRKSDRKGGPAYRYPLHLIDLATNQTVDVSKPTMQIFTGNAPELDDFFFGKNASGF